MIVSDFQVALIVCLQYAGATNVVTSKRNQSGATCFFSGEDVVDGDDDDEMLAVVIIIWILSRRCHLVRFAVLTLRKKENSELHMSVSWAIMIIPIKYINESGFGKNEARDNVLRIIPFEDL